MKRRLPAVLLVLALAVALYLLQFKLEQRMENTINTVLAIVKENPSVWEEQLLHAAEQGVPDEQAVRNLLLEVSGEIRDIRCSYHGNGVELIGRSKIIEKEGVLLSLEEIDPVPRGNNWGWTIEPLETIAGVNIYRFHYYFD